MKLHIFSDLHGAEHTIHECDLAINCGDTCNAIVNNPNNTRIIKVKGNHDYWNKPIENEINIEKIEEYYIISCTLFSNIYKKLRLQDIMSLNDFRYINEYNVDKHQELFEYQLKQIKTFVENHKENKIIIATHFAPSYKCALTKYRNERINNYFCNDLNEFIKANPNVILWACGHCHNNSDFMIGKTRIIANPHGMPNENKEFNKNLIVEI